jgi:hypothetical protein
MADPPAPTAASVVLTWLSGLQSVGVATIVTSPYVALSAKMIQTPRGALIHIKRCDGSDVVAERGGK